MKPMYLGFSTATKATSNQRILMDEMKSLLNGRRLVSITQSQCCVPPSTSYRKQCHMENFEAGRKCRNDMIQVLDLRCQNQERPQDHGQHGHRTWDRDLGHMGQGPGFRDPDPGDIPGNQIRNLDAVGDDFLQGMCAHMWKHDDNMFLPS